MLHSNKICLRVAPFEGAQTKAAPSGAVVYMHCIRNVLSVKTL